MKRTIILLFIAILIAGCCTTEYVEVPLETIPILEPIPKRSELFQRGEGETPYHFMLCRIKYYSDLVEEWESWGISVFKAVDQPIPEILFPVIIEEENDG